MGETQANSIDAGTDNGAPFLVPMGVLTGKRAIALTRPVTTVGSRHNSRVHLLSRSVSKAHALIVKSNGKIYIADMASRSGIMVDGHPLKYAELQDGQQIQIGKFLFEFRHPQQAADGATQLEAPPASLNVNDELPVLIQNKFLMIGRRGTCEIPLSDDASVSTSHAVVFEMDGAWYVRDLGSRSGTKVNNKPIHQQQLEFGDVIQIGATRLRLEAGEAEQPEFVPESTDDSASDVAPLAELGVDDITEDSGDASEDIGVDLGIDDIDIAPIRLPPVVRVQEPQPQSAPQQPKAEPLAPLPLEEAAEKEETDEQATSDIGFLDLSDQTPAPEADELVDRTDPVAESEIEAPPLQAHELQGHELQSHEAIEVEPPALAPELVEPTVPIVRQQTETISDLAPDSNLEVLTEVPGEEPGPTLIDLDLHDLDDLSASASHHDFQLEEDRAIAPDESSEPALEIPAEELLPLVDEPETHVENLAAEELAPEITDDEPLMPRSGWRARLAAEPVEEPQQAPAPPLLEQVAEVHEAPFEPISVAPVEPDPNSASVSSLIFDGSEESVADDVEIIDHTEPTPESAQELEHAVLPVGDTPAAIAPPAQLTDTTFGRDVEEFTGPSTGPIVELSPADEPTEARSFVESEQLGNLEEFVAVPEDVPVDVIEDWPLGSPAQEPAGEHAPEQDEDFVAPELVLEEFSPEEEVLPLDFQEEPGIEPVAEEPVAQAPELAAPALPLPVEAEPLVPVMEAPPAAAEAAAPAVAVEPPAPAVVDVPSAPVAQAPPAPSKPTPSIFGFNFDGQSFLGGGPLKLNDPPPAVGKVVYAFDGKAVRGMQTSDQAGSKPEVKPAAEAAPVAEPKQIAEPKPAVETIPAAEIPPVPPPAAFVVEEKAAEEKPTEPPLAPAADETIATEPLFPQPSAIKPPTVETTVRAPASPTPPPARPASKSAIPTLADEMVVPPMARPMKHRLPPRKPLTTGFDNTPGRGGPRSVDVFSQKIQPISEDTFSGQHGRDNGDGSPVTERSAGGFVPPPFGAAPDPDRDRAPALPASPDVRSDQPTPRPPGHAPEKPRPKRMGVNSLLVLMLLVLGGAWAMAYIYIPHQSKVTGTLAFSNLSLQPVLVQRQIELAQLARLSSDDVRAVAKSVVEAEHASPGFLKDALALDEAINKQGQTEFKGETLEITAPASDEGEGRSQMNALLVALVQKDADLVDVQARAKRDVEEAKSAVAKSTFQLEEIRNRRKGLQAAGEERPDPMELSRLEGEAKRLGKLRDAAKESQAQAEAVLASLRQADANKPLDAQTDPELVQLRKERAEFDTQLADLQAAGINSTTQPSAALASGQNVSSQDLVENLQSQASAIQTKIDQRLAVVQADQAISPQQREVNRQRAVEEASIRLDSRRQAALDAASVADAAEEKAKKLHQLLNQVRIATVMMSEMIEQQNSAEADLKAKSDEQAAKEKLLAQSVVPDNQPQVSVIATRDERPIAAVFASVAILLVFSFMIVSANRRAHQIEPAEEVNWATAESVPADPLGSPVPEEQQRIAV